GIPAIGAFQKTRQRKLRRLLCGELMRPGYARAWIRARPLGFVFGVKGGLVIVIAVPHAPAFGADVRTEPAVSVDHLRIRTPRAAEVYAAAAVFAREPTAVENETARLLRIGAGLGGYIPGALAVDLALTENRGGISENEIDVTFDIASIEEVPAGGAMVGVGLGQRLRHELTGRAVDIQRVLPSQETAVTKDSAVRTHE